MAAVSCANCGLPLTGASRFCADCGVRVGADPSMAIEEVPEETEPIAARFRRTPPRYFGVTPPTLVLALAVAAFLGAIALLGLGRPIAGAALLAAAVLALILFVQTARRVPDTALARLSAGAVDTLRARAGLTLEALAAHSAARRQLLPLRYELAELVARRSHALRELGEAVYRDDPHATAEQRDRVRELEELVAEKEGQMTRIAARAQERIERAQFPGAPVKAVEPPPMPEPYPPPAAPPEPARVPEPSPVPSEPPAPVPMPEPTPQPSPPPAPPVPEPAPPAPQ